MQKIRVNGGAIRIHRKWHPRLSRQKALAHKVGISERKLRDIETRNETLNVALIDRIAAALDVRGDEIVFSSDGPKLVPPPARTAPLPPHPTVNWLQGKQLVPRFDKDSARFVRSDAALFESVTKAELIKVEIQTELNSETTTYVEELIALAREASRENRDYFSEVEEPRAKAITKRMRELLVLLKGNDVWVFICDHTKHFPECDEVPVQRTWKVQRQAIIAFGPPGEWGENSVDVDVDNGQPFIIDWDVPLSCPKKNPASTQT